MSEYILHGDQHIDFLKHIWRRELPVTRRPDEVRRELTSVDLEGKHLMDIGCGSGAIALLLVKDYGAAT